MRLALVTETFPTLSELFVAAHAAELKERGIDLAILARRGRPEDQRHALLADAGLMSCLQHRPDLEGSKARRLLDLTRRLSSLSGQDRRRVIGSLTRVSAPCSRLSSAAYAAQLLAQPAFDVVHVHFGHIALNLVPLWSRSKQPPMVVTFHGYDANVIPRRFGRDLYKPLFEVAAHVTANSQFLSDRLRELGCPEEKLSVVRMAVDTARIGFHPKVRAEGAPLRVLTVARLVPVKGIDIALQAIARLVGKGVPVEYTVAGDGPLRATLSEQTRTLGIANHVRFLGACSDQEISALLREHDLFVLPSVRTPRGDEETQGVVVQEAQAAGLPVVVSDIGGIAEGIVPGRSGEVFRSGDARDLADRLVQLLHREQAWMDMARVGRQLVEDRYSVRVMSASFQRIYETVLERETHWARGSVATTSTPP